ncbi:MAG: hydrogenase maturation protease [Methylobacter sp.]|nr:hydrogenase maturation protease [Methylobacter sp.]MDP2098004.1 hydrogenase maturation protease [Methylobacter sp.]MDP2427823.1 hydrogenase maturation protease [Methylobacter sp.]MDP3055079.1 hydrogenase maturation protease [Methylobacter sp.]MDP3362054.1 hydrogenase maturation protease [Methylobacter sp.]
MRHIICFGNELHGDDGFGTRVYAQLHRLSWPKNIEVFNAGVAGLNALRFLENCSQAILVDALVNFGNVGEICVLRPEDLADRPEQLTGHGLGLPYLLEALKVVRDPLPDILIVGVEIAAVSPFSSVLSDKTEQAVPKTVQLIRGLLSE